MDRALAIAKAGLNRFYDVGFTIWSKDNLKALFINVNIEADAIQLELECWRANGWVRLPRTKDEYLIVLAAIH